MELSLQKKKMREELRERARRIDPVYQKEASEAICRILPERPEYRAAGTVLAFVGTRLEIDTGRLLRRVWADGKTLCVPRCRERFQMDLCKIESYDDLEKGAYGIQEPKADCLIVPPEEVDFAVIPCLSFDKEGNRLGQGGGYYDRFLERLRCPTFLVCRGKFTAEYIPHGEHDRKCDYLVTEDGVFPVGKKN